MEFENDNIQTENPFVDKLMKNLKILAYNSIIKDDYRANKEETIESYEYAETYMACMENRVSLNMFTQIPDTFLREVGLPESTIRAYSIFENDVNAIPMDTGGYDASGKHIQSNDTIVNVKGKWYITHGILGTVNSYDELPVLEKYVSNGDMYTMNANSGVDGLGVEIRYGDTVVYVDKQWYIVNMEKMIDTYAHLPANTKSGDVYIISNAGGVDSKNNPIKAGDMIIKIKKDWFIIDNYKTVIDSFDNLPGVAKSGDMYTTTSYRGYSKMVGAYTEPGDSVACVNNLWYVLNNTLRTVNGFLDIPSTAKTGDIYTILEGGTVYRYELIKKLRPWFLLNFDEKNEYYRMITGKPPLGDWGIPLRDYKAYIPDKLYNDLEQIGDFIHELGTSGCKELDKIGVLDIIKKDYPSAKYLNYLLAGLSSYEARKALDFMILWVPDTCDELITREFKFIYEDRRNFIIKSVYDSTMEIESEHYHATMQIYLLVMVMLDMLSEVQTYITKKSILDRRCIEYFFSLYGVPYDKTLPYKYQEKICHVLHTLVKYKACSKEFDIIKSLFEMDDVAFFRFYLMRTHYRNSHGDLIWKGDKVTKCIPNNDYVIHDIKSLDVPTNDIKIPFPVENYIDRQYYYDVIADGKIFNNYSIVENNLFFLYENIKNYTNISIHFGYSEYNDINILSKEVILERETSDEFDVTRIPFPVPDFVEAGNYFIMTAGNDNIILDKYTYDANNIYLEYEDVKFYTKINITFVYSNKRWVTIEEHNIDPSNDENISTEFYIDLPVDDYIDKNNEIIVTVNDNEFTNYSIINNKIKFLYDDIKSYSKLYIHLIYSTVSDKLYKLETEIDNIETNYIDIPEPCIDYIDNNWLVFVKIGDKLLTDSNYDIVGSEFTTYPIEQINDLNNLKFVFYYINKEPYIYEEYEEDYEKTTELMFSKVPDADLYSVKNLLDEMNWKIYDIVLYKDPWWVGKDYKEDEYSIVKNAILQSENNYFRTKYYAMGRMIEISSNSAKLAFFFGTLFDDITSESNLKVSIPLISHMYEFNIAHIFLYLSALTSMFQNREDTIEEITTVKKASGFNYKADLDSIKEYIISHHFEPQYFEIWNMIIPTEEYKDMDEFMDVLHNNEDVYHYIRHQLVESHDYREYCIWRYIYEYLMTWDFNQEYFKLKNRLIAPTYTEFLKEKDEVLYDSLMEIASIEDEEVKIDTITQTIDDICYVLKEYLDSELYKYAFAEFVGQSTAYMMQYIMTLVNYFKSIKIMFREKGEIATAGGGGFKTINEDTVILYYDYFDCLNIMRRYEYMHFDEKLYSLNISRQTETFIVKEDCEIIHKIIHKDGDNREEETIDVDRLL